MALYTSSGVLEDTRNIARMHNQLLLGMIDALITRGGLVVQQLDAIAFAAGPGSFTGVRIGAATCQAIAYGADIGVACISSSLALATRARQNLATLEGVYPLIASVRGAAYVSAYKVVDDGLQVCADDALMKQPPVLSFATNVNWRFTGAEWPWKGEPQLVYEPSQVDAVVIAELALGTVQSGQLVSAELALPRYVRGDHPWK